MGMRIIIGKYNYSNDRIASLLSKWLKSDQQQIEFELFGVAACQLP